MLSDEELQSLSGKHERARDSRGIWRCAAASDGECQWWQTWPCPTRKLLDMVVAQRVAIQRIHDDCGKVCNEFETCAHTACRSSFDAWAIADCALKGTTPEEDNERARREFFGQEPVSQTRHSNQ